MDIVSKVVYKRDCIHLPWANFNVKWAQKSAIYILYDHAPTIDYFFVVGVVSSLNTTARLVSPPQFLRGFHTQSIVSSQINQKAFCVDILQNLRHDHREIN